MISVPGRGPTRNSSPARRRPGAELRKVRRSPLLRVGRCFKSKLAGPDPTPASEVAKLRCHGAPSPAVALGTVTQGRDSGAAEPQAQAAPWLSEAAAAELAPAAAGASPHLPVAVVAKLCRLPAAATV